MGETTDGPIASLFRPLRISSRIYASFASLLILFLIAFAIACVGLVRLKNNVLRYAQADRLATIIDRIDRDVIELQRDVLVYAASGNESAPDRVASIGQSLRDQIEMAMTFPNDEVTTYRLSEMKLRLENYLTSFPEVILDRNTRQTLVGESLLELESKTRTAFDRLRLVVSARTSDTLESGDSSPSLKPEPIDADGSQDRIIIVERSMSLVALAQLKALRFFNDPDVSNVRESLALLTEAKTDLQKISGVDDDEAASQAKDLITLLEEYEKNFFRAVQATRGYLSLVNVVMAGEASEFLYQSQQIQQRTALETSRLSTETVATANRSTIAAIGLAISALLIALFVTWLVVRGIVNPISAMTATFSQLMQGNNEATIPGLERSDEIGDMARAADTFRDRNRQTEELLHQSRQLAMKLDENSKELARSNDDLNSFAYVASHDLRSPLRAIDNISSWIEEDIGDQIPKETKEHLGELRRRVRRMDQLLNELLEYSRVGLGKSNLTETDLRSVFSDISSLLDMPPDGKVVVQGIMPIVLIDRGSISRVILNLLTNAIKYRSKKPLLITCQCDVVGHTATFHISDNGIGVAPVFHSRIFEMFKRLHRQSEIEGTGMGLALVKKIVHQAGGTVEIDSDTDKGACFTFTWPVLFPSDADRKNSAQLEVKNS